MSYIQKLKSDFVLLDVNSIDQMEPVHQIKDEDLEAPFGLGKLKEAAYNGPEDDYDPDDDDNADNPDHVIIEDNFIKQFKKQPFYAKTITTNHNITIIQYHGSE